MVQVSILVAFRSCTLSAMRSKFRLVFIVSIRRLGVAGRIGVMRELGLT
jgi:hypothetical protein